MYRNNEINLIRFDNSTELAAFAKRFTKQSAIGCMKGVDESFYGATSGAQAMRYATTGNDANVASAQAMLDKLLLDFETLQVQDEPDVVGAYPVVAEYMMGMPDSMRMPTMVGSEAAPLSVFLDLTTSMNMTPEQCRIRGLAVLALVIALSQTRPLTLEVGCVMHGHHASGMDDGEEVCFVSCRIDTAPLDLATAAWMTTDPAACRRLLHGAAFDQCGFNGKWPTLTGATYSQPQSAEHINRVREILDLPGETLYIPAVSTLNGDARMCIEQPAEWVQEKFNEFKAGASLN